MTMQARQPWDHSSLCGFNALIRPNLWHVRVTCLAHVDMGMSNIATWTFRIVLRKHRRLLKSAQLCLTQLCLQLSLQPARMRQGGSIAHPKNSAARSDWWINGLIRSNCDPPSVAVFSLRHPFLLDPVVSFVSCYRKISHTVMMILGVTLIWLWIKTY
jgi:hypothetical protein